MSMEQFLMSFEGNLGYQPVNRVKGEWKPWFAWRPVRVDDSWVWLKKIYRRRSCLRHGVPADIQTHYGTLFDVIKEQHNDDDSQPQIKFPGRFYV